MINVKVFEATDYEEANKFIDSVDVSQDGVEFKDNKIVVFYRPEPSLAELEAKRVAKRLRMVQENLVDQLIHREFLKVVVVDASEADIDEAKKKNETEIANLEAQIELYKAWQILMN